MTTPLTYLLFSIRSLDQKKRFVRLVLRKWSILNEIITHSLILFTRVILSHVNQIDLTLLECWTSSALEHLHVGLTRIKTYHQQSVYILSLLCCYCASKLEPLTPLVDHYMWQCSKSMFEHNLHCITCMCSKYVSSSHYAFKVDWMCVCVYASESRESVHASIIFLAFDSGAIIIQYTYYDIVSVCFYSQPCRSIR